MQVLFAVIIATALMLSAYNPKQTNKRIPPQRHLNKPSRRNRRVETDTPRVVHADSVVTLLPVHTTIAPGTYYLLAVNE